MSFIELGIRLCFVASIVLMAIGIFGWVQTKDRWWFVVNFGIGLLINLMYGSLIFYPKFEVTETTWGNPTIKRTEYRRGYFFKSLEEAGKAEWQERRKANFSTEEKRSLTHAAILR